MEKGKIVKRKPGIIYQIKTADNKKIDSIKYSKNERRLKAGEEVDIEIVDGKAKILNEGLTPIYIPKKSDYVVLLIILIVALVIGFLSANNIINLNHTTILILMISIFIISFIDSTIKTILIYKKGEIQEVTVIDKEEIDNNSDHSAPISMRYTYILKVELNDGTQISGNMQYDKRSQKIKLGDKIKIRFYKNYNYFILEDEK